MKITQKTKNSIRWSINAIAVLAAVIIVFIVANLVLESFGSKLTIDMTSEKLYSVSDVTIEEMNNLDKEVEIYALYDRLSSSSNSNRSTIMKILDVYDSFTKVSVTYVDLDQNPSFLVKTVGQSNASSYQEGDYIVKCGDKFRRIGESDMFATSTGTYEGIYSYSYVSGVQAEKKLTTAIIYVTSEVSPVVYYMSGHGEDSRDNYTTLFNYIESLGTDIKEANMIEWTEVPDDAAVLIFMSPKDDISSEQRVMLEQWIQMSDGQFVFSIDPTQSGTEFTNINALLTEYYALSFNNDAISDEEMKIASFNNVQALWGESVSNGPVKNSSVYRMPIIQSRSIDILKVDTTSTHIDHAAIMHTYNTAYSTNIVTGDVSDKGVFTVAACAANGYYTDNYEQPSRAVLFGSSIAFTDSAYENFGTYSRLDLSVFAMSVDWMINSYGENVGRNIDVKNYNTASIAVDGTQSSVLFILSVIVIPVVIIGIGVLVFFRRKNK